MKSVHGEFGFRVNDEKESRQYLEDLTRLLKEDIDQLKQTVMVGHQAPLSAPTNTRQTTEDVTWQQRRNNKVN